MSQYNIKQVTVEEIINTGFIFKIPDYQRGYRWGETEVKDLLTDIDEIKSPEKSTNALLDKETITKYCLQPVVFDCAEEEQKIMHVVDGQQRLTTLYLILRFVSKTLLENKSKIEDRLIEDGYDDSDISTLFNLFGKQYTLQYINNERERIFTEVKDNLNNINKENIDAYFISTAYSIIVNWARDKAKGNLIRIKEDGTEQVIIPNLLCFAAKLYKATTVIWYELDPETDGKPGDYFAKINSGKIALTNSELIKANLMLDEYCLEEIELQLTPTEQQSELLKAEKIENLKKLKQTQLSAERIKISRQWDEIEENLRNNEFWQFITDLTEKYNDTRIDFLFDILAREKYPEIAEDNETYEKFIELNEERATFIILARYLKKQQGEPHEKPVSIQLWKEIWDCYMTFKEWFNNRELYHYIGYIIAVDPKYKAERLRNIISQPNYKNKKDIKNALVDIIRYEAGNLYYTNNKTKDDDSLNESFEHALIRNKENYFNFIDNLDYDNSSDKPAILKTLLLFNVISILNDKTKTIQAARDTFFPFGRYKSENWNLEHVHSKADGESFTKDTAKLYIEYIEKMLTILTDKESEDYKALKSGYDTFESKYEELKVNDPKGAYTLATHECAVIIERQFGAELNADSLNSLGNLALLDEKTNKSYHNVPFFMKRMIISNIVNGNDEDVSRFIPLCTRNVFDKSFSEIPGNTLHWTDTDCNDYLNVIKNTIWNFFEVNTNER